MSGINAGLPTDRFEVEWWIDSQRVVETVSGTKTNAPSPNTTPIINPAHFDYRNLPIPPNLPAPSSLAPSLLLEIPASFQHIKAKLTPIWRNSGVSTRALYLKAYSMLIMSLQALSKTKVKQPRSFYLLTSASFVESVKP